MTNDIADSVNTIITNILTTSTCSRLLAGASAGNVDMFE